MIGTAGQGIVNTPYQVTDRALAAKEFGFSGSLERAIEECATNSDNILAFRCGTKPMVLKCVGLSNGLGIAVPGTVTATGSSTGGTLAAATYYYKVTALNAAGETVGSLEANVTTTGTTSSVSLAWGAVTGATSYKVYRGTAAGLESVFYTTTTNSHTDTGATSAAGTVPTVNTTAIVTAGFDITFNDVTSDAGTRYQTATHNMTRCFCSAAHEKSPRARGRASPDPRGPGWAARRNAMIFYFPVVFYR